MGNRAQIGFRQDGAEPIIYLYTHWEGDDLYEMTKQAIDAAEPRWGDAEYATRIALTTLIGSVKGETGWGVGTYVHGDLAHYIPVIDWERQEVKVYDPRLGDPSVESEDDEPITFSMWVKSRVLL